jgi:TRAP-type uncharacterized transport system substrate-binding protein
MLRPLPARPTNARNTQAGNIDLGLATSDVCLAAMEGIKAFEGSLPRLRALFAFMDLFPNAGP